MRVEGGLVYLHRSCNARNRIGSHLEIIFARMITLIGQKSKSEVLILNFINQKQGEGGLTNATWRI